ncbi:SDR family NAD(P)-dependent oxidoreductase [uncultured Phenylobacterium sp.]|uniref:SDR family NAD(P)-dependent oxidoreductase n=1 Tax=uncultured Phenylobacterium sp. TaxID=349273 RepID=UPI0025D1A44F|nr:SDR family NAD(P)-dependent oxidoreductase [uncultured Phenylobacterium sp.]
MYDLTGKVAVITGAASGMGRAAAILFASKGANVVLADLNTKGGEDVAAEASAGGARCVFQRTDVSEEADVEALIGRAISEFGKLDILFNNAGIGGAVGPLEDISVEDWDKTQDVCLRGVFLGIKHAIAPMRANGSGSIISTASIAGIDGFNGLHAYCAAKAGVVNLTRSASLQLACDFIRVNCIAPGGVSTPIVWNGSANKEMTEGFLINAQPMPQVGQPLDIANAALFLASDAASFITGHTLVVDGGATAGAVATASKRGQAAPPRSNRAFAGPSFELG